MRRPSPGIAAILTLTVTVLGAIGIGVAVVATQPRPAVIFAPLNATSELVTLTTTGQSGQGTTAGTQITKLAVRLNTPHVGLEYVVRDNQAYPCRSPLVPCIEVIDGVTYVRGTNGWLEVPNTASIADPYAITNPENSYRYFDKIAVGPISDLGPGLVGGIPTEEHRATVSAVSIYRFGGSPLASMEGLAYQYSNPLDAAAPNRLVAVDEWFDERGTALQAQVVASPPAVETFPSRGASASSAPPSTVTITISDFGVPVRVDATPPKIVRMQPTQQSTKVSGTVAVRSSDGRKVTERGLLVLTSVESEPAGRVFKAPQLAAVGPDGRFTSRVFVPVPLGDAFSQRLTANFYPKPGAALHCPALTEDFVSGDTTTGVDFVCSS